MNRLTREQMIGMAVQMRSRDRFGPVTEEEFAAYPAEEKVLEIPTTQGSAKVFLIKPQKVEGQTLPLMINFHGGGFIKGRLDRDKLFCFKLANELSCMVLDVDYKLAPEYQFPVATNESYEVVQWAFENADKLGIDAHRIALVGHSAGGNLVVESVIRTGEERSFMPKCIVVEYAPLDLHTDPFEKPRPERDLPPERARVYNSFYCKPEETESYRVSPLFAPSEKLAVFPKTLMITAGDDSLCNEGQAFAKQLSQSGVAVTHQCFLNSVHGFTINRMDKYEEAFQLIVRFLKENL